MLDREPLIAPLVAVAHVGSIESPFAIIVLRDALASRHRWVRAMALDELLRFDARDLAEFGGPALVRALVAAAERNVGEASTLARRLLEKIAARYPEALRREGDDGPWRFDENGFPEGSDLPEPERAAPGGGRSFPFVRGNEMVERLLPAVVTGVDEDVLRRIVRLIARVEGW